MNNETTKLITVHPEDVPAFSDEAEEEAWWATHDVDGPWKRREPDDGRLTTEELVAQRLAQRGLRRTQPVLVRLDADILDRLRALADRKGTGYQTLIKRFITERLYQEETLEGLFGAPHKPVQESTPRMAGRDMSWAQGRITMRQLFQKDEAWLRTHWIGYNPGKRVLYDPTQTGVLRRREDFPFHDDQRHGAGGLGAGHWTRADEFVRVLREVHGLGVVAM
jgi:uncharacterized protein (DUF4415 family)